MNYKSVTLLSQTERRLLASLAMGFTGLGIALDVEVLYPIPAAAFIDVSNHL